MGIEFRCTNCDKLLRTEDGTGGKKAKCPQCGTVVDIPYASQSAAGADFAAPPPREPSFQPQTGAGGFAPPPGAGAAANPYQSPGAYTPVEQVGRGFQPTRIEFGDTLSRTWEIYKANLGPLIGGFMLFLVCSWVATLLVQLPFTLAAMNMEGGAAVVMTILQQAVGQAVSVFFWAGMILFTLRIARGETVEFGALFAGGPYLLNAFLLQIILLLAVVGGLVLFIVGAIVIGLMLSQSFYMLVDQQAGIGASLKMSVAAMKGNKLTLLAIWIVAGLLGMLFMLVTCFIGVIFVGPYLALLMTVVYLGVTGQKTVLDGAPQAAPSAFGAQPAG